MRTSLQYNEEIKLKMSEVVTRMKINQLDRSQFQNSSSLQSNQQSLRYQPLEKCASV